MIAEASRLADGTPPILRLDMLIKRGWACVAVEDELEGDAAATLAKACASHGYTSGCSVEIPWLPNDYVPASHSFSLSTRNFHTLSKDTYIGSCFVLWEIQDRFAISSSGDLYWMIAGPRAFVEDAVGISIGDALQSFGKTAASYGDTLAGSRLKAVQEIAVTACADATI